MSLLLAVPLIALTAACGGGSGSGSGAGSGGGGAAAPASDAQVKYAKCMRGNGVPDFPDQIPGSGYSIKDMAAYEKAQKACRSQRTAVYGFDELDPEVFDGRVKYARCMRDQGMKVHDPDPKTGGYQVEVDPKDRAAFEKAMNACRKNLSPKETNK
ncbi:hypothetical protein D5H75_23780 [Bailinhaonella thermotolerans]|uniref:Uncharacterized protein n=1 Tax=Bailinhaonella thermotolerans TaxID=1070861 RepID=A0A3A4AN85_9ACTN|nr:hypothetical protein D5H75_23780 [Bailinhaonella thermotolerans]